MADKITEEFNSTEIDVEELIRNAEKSEDWEFISPFEADDYKVPYISFPKMFEDVDYTPYATNVESRAQNRQGASSQYHFESKKDGNDEVKHEQLPPNEEHKEREKIRLIREAMQDISFQDREQRNKPGKEIDEAMQDTPILSRQEKDEDLRRALDEAIHDEARHDEHRNVQEKNRLIAEIKDSMLGEPQSEQESVKVRTETNLAERGLLGNEQEKEKIKKIYEGFKQEQKSSSLQPGLAYISLPIAEDYPAATQDNSNSASAAQNVPWSAPFFKPKHMTEIESALASFREYQDKKLREKGHLDCPCSTRYETRLLKPKETELPIDSGKFRMFTKSPENLQKKQTSKRITEKEHTDTQSDPQNPSAAECVEKQIHADGESLPKEKSESGCPVSQREGMETFHEDFQFNTVSLEKSSTETEKVDKLEK